MRKKTAIILDKIQRLINQGKTPGQIAIELGVNQHTISNYCYRHGIKNPHRSLSVTLTPEQEQVVIGSLLGDGSIEKSKSAGTRLCIEHSIVQSDYVAYKHEMLYNFSKKIQKGIKYDDRIKRGFTEYCKFRTCYLQQLKKYRDNWYRPNKRLYLPDFKRLQSLGLAIWFMDDGYKNNNTITISTMCFSLEDITLMGKYLKRIFNLHFYINKEHELVLYSSDLELFQRIVKPYVLPSLCYKLNMTSEVGEFGESPEMDNPEPSQDLNDPGRCNA